MPRAALALYSPFAIAVLVALWLERGLSHWEYSDGVYAYTARAVLGGVDLHGEIVAAQPPPLFYVGAGMLAVGDGVATLRAGLALVAFTGGALAVMAIWRLTHGVLASAAGGLAALVTPWALHEHAVLTPEAFAGPLLLGAALAASRPRWAWAGGALAALAAAFKLSYMLPLAALAIVAARRGPYLATAAVTTGLLWAAFLALHGRALIDDVVVAQGQAGAHGARELAGLVVQGAWNLAPLVGLCALALVLRARAADPALVHSLTALLVGALALFVTLVKDGSYLNFLTVVELPATVLAAAAVHWALVGVRAGHALVRAGALACVALAAAQSAALLVRPDRPLVFLRPLSAPAHGRLLSDTEVRGAVAAARGCPDGIPYSGEPYLAFVARRPMPGGQADQFIVSEAAVHAARRRAVAAAEPRCP